MLEFYPQIKCLHIATVLVSGGVFTLRGLFMLAGSPWSQQPVLKNFTYLNDSVLLAAGLLLMGLTHQYPTDQPWLVVKLALLVVYIGLGIWALRKGRSRAQRAAFFAAALATYLVMLSVARTREPLGLFALLAA